MQPLRGRVSLVRSSSTSSENSNLMTTKKAVDRPPQRNRGVSQLSLMDNDDELSQTTGWRSKAGKVRRLPWRHSLMRYFRVRWLLLSPPARLCCTISLPFLALYAVIELMDILFSRYGGSIIYRVKESVPQSFAVVINTYQRPQQLADAVRHYADTCGVQSGVNHVYIVWAEENVLPPSAESFFRAKYIKRESRHYSNRAAVSVVKVKNSLNSRFLPIKGASDASIFMVDDDIRVDCKSLQQGFAAWKSSPDAMVGYYPRLAQNPTIPGGDFVYHSWPIVFWRNRMNFVLTKACFLHSRYMAIYSSDQHPQEIKDYIDKYFNCEDVAMALLVANITKYENSRPVPPIYVEGRVSDKGLFNGISTGTGHMARRSQCLADLTAIYKSHGWGTPLDTTTSLRESSWLHHIPGFWWQSRPSNFFEWFALANVLK